MTTEFYMQTTGSNLNAGSTSADAASLTYASGSWVSTTGVFTVASGNPLTDGVAVGDWTSVYVDGSTVTPFTGKVTARDSTTITVSLTVKFGTVPATGSGRSLKVGGAWASLAITGTSLVLRGGAPAGDAYRLNIKAGTYNEGSAVHSTNLAGQQATPFWIRGYRTAIGDIDSEDINDWVAGTDLPHFVYTTGSLTFSGGWIRCRGLSLYAESTGLATLRASSDSFYAERLICESGSILPALRMHGGCVLSKLIGGAACASVVHLDGSTLPVLYDCYISGGVNGVLVSSSSSISNCLITGCSQDAVTIDTSCGLVLDGCTIHDIGRDGVRISSSPLRTVITSNIFSECAGTGINQTSLAGPNYIHKLFNLFYDNGADETATDDNPALFSQTDLVTPFTDAAGGDFGLVSTSNGRDNGGPATVVGTINDTYLDIGAVQYASVTVAVSPTLTAVDNGDGTATFTISGGVAGATNTVYGQHHSATVFSSLASRVDNGTVSAAVTVGRYYLYVKAVVDGAEAVSSVITLLVGSLESTLTHSPADIIGALLVSLGLGTDPEADDSWPVNVVNEPTSPDSCITVYDTSGRTEGRFQTSGETQEHQGIQIRVRAAEHAVGWTKIHAILNAIDTGVYDATVAVESESYLVHNVTRTGGVLSLGKEDSSDRRLFTLNAIVSVRQLD
jgi:hypothetical protein